ncbi:hypothetical protein ABK249_14515 [Neorhizobium sp. Rsf11]|uniref:Uncharacterized protein n=1 Tax=Neorhizobium phenanthreniclasticum TaxID=3157917 RepID=A0ABV0M2S5_9HYPH
MRDLHHNLGFAVAIPAAVYDADNTPAAVDLLGFDSAVIEISVGVGGITFTGTNKVEFKLTHSDDDSTYSAVTVDDVIGLASVGTGGIIKSLIAAHAAADITKVGYIGNKRYLKLLADFGGTHAAGTPIAASVIKGNAASRPVA